MERQLFAPSRAVFPKWRVASRESSFGRPVLVVASVVLASLAAALFAWPLWRHRVDSSAATPSVWLAGQEIAAGPDGDFKALEVVRRYAKAAVTIELRRGGSPEKRVLSR